MHKRNKNHTSDATPSRTATGRESEVVFTLERAKANQVYLCGDFNSWSETNLPMIGREAGQWEKRLSLLPGRYEYKFIVDGEWTHDLNARENSPNVHGSLNSVVEVQ